MLLLLLLACERIECPSGSARSWTPVEEEEARLDGLLADWEPVRDAMVVVGVGECSMCVGVSGGVGQAGAIFNRGVPHHLAATVDSDGGARIGVVEEASGVEVASAESETGEAEVTLDFDPPKGGPSVITLEALDGGLAILRSLEVTAPAWTVAEDPPAAPVLLGFLVHVEEDTQFTESEARWSGRARVIEGLSATLAAHGAKLGFQPHATFVRGAAVWDAGWIDARTAEGVGWSVHLHGEDEGENLERAAREGRQAFEDAGLDVGDLNGGFQTAAWSRMRDIGFRSLSAYKDANDQGGLPVLSSVPWRPADGAGSEDPERFLVDDPDGPLVYLPGSPVREVDHARAPEFAERVLSQVLAHAEPDRVNVWHFMLHVDDFGPADQDAREAYLADGSFEADLAGWDRALSEVVDPLVEEGWVEYATPDEMRERYLAWEDACR